MPIEITGVSPSQTQNPNDGSRVKVARDEPTKPQEETGRPSTGETVSLTDTSAKLRALENTLSSLPAVDAQRVEALKKAVASGEYEVDPARVAEKLIALEQGSTRG